MPGGADVAHNSRGVILAELMSAWGYSLVPVFGDVRGECAPYTCVRVDGNAYSTVDYMWVTKNVHCPAGAHAHTLHWADKPRPSCHAALVVDLSLAPGSSTAAPKGSPTPLAGAQPVRVMLTQRERTLYRTSTWGHLPPLLAAAGDNSQRQQPKERVQ